MNRLTSKIKHRNGRRLYGYWESTTIDGAEIIYAAIDRLAAYEDMDFEPEEVMELGAEVGRLREAQRWIPVGERLPAHNEKVLAYISRDRCKRIEMLWFAEIDEIDFPGDSNIFYGTDSESGCYPVDDITHWMPLPAPPEEGESK